MTVVVSHAQGNPPQRVRHELRRPHPARDVGASARSLDALHRSRPLGVAGADAGTRAVRRIVPGRHPRRLRRVPGLAGRLDPQCGADPGERSAAAGAGHGLCDAASRLRRHLQPDLRAALYLRPPHVDARPPDQGTHRLERRHRLSRQRRARHGPGAAAGARQPLRRGRGIHAGGLPALGRKLGRRAPCCATAPGGYTPIRRASIA